MWKMHATCRIMHRTINVLRQIVTIFIWDFLIYDLWTHKSGKRRISEYMLYLKFTVYCCLVRKNCDRRLHRWWGMWCIQTKLLLELLLRWFPEKNLTGVLIVMPSFRLINLLGFFFQIKIIKVNLVIIQTWRHF